MTIRRGALLAAAALVAILLMVLLRLRSSPPPGPLVVVQVPVRPHAARAEQAGAWPVLLPSGSRLVLLSPHGDAVRLKALTRSFHAACDPSLSADGSCLVFAGRKHEQDRWQVWEMRARGGRARRVLAFDGDCAGPIYVPENGDPSSPTYVPDGRVLFAGRLAGAGSRGNAAALAGEGTTRPHDREPHEYSQADGGGWQLYSCRRDGSDLTRLTYGAGPTYDPTVLSDGRLVFATWHWRHRRGPQPPLGALWHMQQDGTCADGLCPGPEGYLKHSPVQSGDHLFFLTTDGPGTAGGKLASIALNRPFTTYEVVSQGLDGEFQSAYPLAQERLIVSYRPAREGASFGLYEFDCAAGEVGRVVYDDPDYDDIDLVVVTPRQPPHGHVTVMIPGKTSGELYCLNVYESQLPNVRRLAPDGIKQVRVYEAASEQAAAATGATALDGGQPQTPSASRGRKLLGQAPVEADGSFYIEVPADRPLQWELLDEHGRAAAQSPVWLWVRPFEHRGCVGCHAPRHRAPDNFIPRAITRQPSAVGVDRQLPIVGFREKIMPVLQARCSTAACHGPGGKAGPKFGAEPAEAPDGTKVSKAYAELVYAMDAANERPRWIYPGSARTSPLLTVMSVHARTDRVELGEEERQMLMKWIDSGAHWDAAGQHRPPAVKPSADPDTKGR